ncbi:MAG: paraquat-inducible protein A [Methyloprofundus sp.]|nr:paraquat-inducible protein A [Methyloprofundus sp.]MDT8425614.1 paraquat-inducible protein A [Methyloprofundus sp.]
MKKYFPALLFILSIGCLIPGIIQPFMTIKAEINKQELFAIAAQELLPPTQQSNDIMQNIVRSVIRDIHFDGSINAFESTRSLWETMSDLVAHDYVVIGLLIGLFGIIIPLIKILLNLIALLLAAGKTRNDVLTISSVLSKWSMSDVFFMAILVSFFTVNANAQEINVIQMSARFEPGFYFFATYCVLAIAAAQLMQLWSNQPAE